MAESFRRDSWKPDLFRPSVWPEKHGRKIILSPLPLTDVRHGRDEMFT